MPTATEEVAAQIDADLDAFLAIMDSHEQVRAVLVFHDGEPVLERYMGGAGPEDYWDLRSVTKSVVSVLIGMTIDQGFIDGVDQTLGELLPDYADVMTPDVAAITLRQVLTHTAGFSDSDSESGLRYWESDDWIRAILTDRSSAPAGDNSFAYSDAGAHVLTAIISQVTGQSALQFARANLFDPLEIPSEPALEPVIVDDAGWTAFYDAGFAWSVDPQGHHEGGFGLKLRPQDLARIGQLYLDGGRWNDEQVVSASWVEASTAPQVEASGTFSTDVYGYLWWVTDVDDDPAYFAFGRGGQMIAVVPDRDLVVVVATEYDERDLLRFSKALQPTGAILMVEEAIAPQFASAD